MFLTEFFGFFSLSAFTMWGFLMAFFFNVFIYSIGLKRETTLLLSSFIMMVSYTVSDYFFNWLSLESTVYLDWALYDYATVIALFLAYKLLKKTSPSMLYIASGLIINSIFSLLMYGDIFINETNEPWFFWDVYTFTVNIVDFIMIVALIVDRDFLGLHKLKNRILSYFKSNNTHKVT